LTAQRSGVSVRLQAISAVDEKIAWVSGLDGTYARTADGGETWSAEVVPGAESLQFRDVEAFDEKTAYLLSAGSGDRSRIYKTSDGGASWILQFINDEPSGFFDCMAFWDSNSGIAFSDAVNHEFIIIRTTDGATWRRVSADRVPDALPGEGGFAASGTCLITYGDSTAWLGTGASDTARVLKTSDRGATWSATATPIVGDSMSGVTSIGFIDELRGLAVGGNIAQPSEQHDNVAQTHDGGATWALAGRPTYPGAIYGISNVPGTKVPVFVAVGPGGADYTLDMGATWVPLDSLNYWSVSFASRSTGWAVGPEGRITKISF
jgi:photosystem II stability/assembly factor-like uncharacterized protein